MIDIDTLVRRREVERITGLSTTSLYRQIREGKFPRPRRIGRRAVAWATSEIRAWQAQCPRTDAPA